MTLRPWRSLGRHLVLGGAWLQAGTERFALPDGRTVDDFHWVEAGGWAMAAAVTAGGELVLERCFKPGIGRVALVLPAGGVRSGERPLEAMRRELLEETGYASDRWEPLGSFRLDPNYGVSTGHLFLAREARRVAEPRSDDLEEIEVVTLGLDRALAALASGEIATMGSAAALGLAALALRRG